MDQLRREVERELRQIRESLATAGKAEAKDAANRQEWAERLAFIVRPARHYMWHLHGLGWQQLTDPEKAEVIAMDSELRRLASLARDYGCHLLPSERESPDHLPGDVPPSMTPE